MNYSAHDQQIREAMNASATAIEMLINGSDISTATSNLTELNSLNGWPCDNCDACFEVLNNLKMINDFASGIIDKSGLTARKLSWDRALYADKALLGLGDMSRLIFAREKHSLDGDLIYLDQNVFSCAMKNSHTREKLFKLKSMGAFFVYSPSHCEDMRKIQDAADREAFLNLISQLTDDASLQPDETTGKISLFKENPSYPLNRVLETADASDFVEKIKLIKYQERDLYFPEKNSETHRKAQGNSTDLFEELPDNEFAKLMALCYTSLASKNEFKGLTLHDEILNAIYALHNAMDLLAYKTEATERSKRSSLHDIEHLIYGTQCRVFVTNDGRLASRARQIYKFMGFPVDVKSLDDFLSASV